MKKKKHVIIVGSGPMAEEYAKILAFQKVSFVVIGRGEKSTRLFEKNTGFTALSGGVAANSEHAKGSHAIVAVSEDQLDLATREILKVGCKEVLVEKPGGSSYAKIQSLYKFAQQKKAKIYIGYNRRFYASVIQAEKIIKKDGGITSLTFDFTEWAHVIKNIKKNKGVKKIWFLHNSTHVVDLAFYLGGKPKVYSPYIAGKTTWHPSSAIFTGSGITTKGSLFSYHANWTSPGRWELEIHTVKHTLIFKPLEQLQIQEIGSIQTSNVKIDDIYDIKFKPGLYGQVRSFLLDKKRLCTLREQVQNLEYYHHIQFSK